MAFLFGAGAATGAGAGATTGATVGTAASTVAPAATAATMAKPSWWSQYGQGMMEKGVEASQQSQARSRQQQDELMQQMMANGGMWSGMIR